jgi:hypothetical protein
VPPSPDELERLLRKARPDPSPDFIRALEASLVPPPERRTARKGLASHWRIAATACAFATALIAIGIVLAIAGALPFGVGAGKNAQAGQDCRTVTVQRRERRARLVQDRHGKLRVRYHTELVRRPVKRCR